MIRVELVRKRSKKIFIFGFVALLLCGVGDWLIGYEPDGGQELIYGITRTTIAQVPTWFYIVSMMFGILSGFGCMLYAPEMVNVLRQKGIPEDSKMFKMMRFALRSAPLMFVSFHAVCCVVLLLIQAVLRAGLDIYSASDIFLLPVAASMLPFLIWCFICDIPATIAFTYFVIKRKLDLPMIAVVCSPMAMSILSKIIGAVLIALGSKFAFLVACGESWGWAFMCLAFCFAVSGKRKGREKR
jgi:hypothetical protein